MTADESRSTQDSPPTREPDPKTPPPAASGSTDASGPPSGGKPAVPDISVTGETVAGRGGSAGDGALVGRDEGRFGTPGPPLSRRNPFIIGFLGGLGLLAAYAIWGSLQDAGSILLLIFIALFIAIGLNPAVSKLRSWGLARGWAVLAVALVAMLLLCGGVVALIPPLVAQTGALIENLPGYIQGLQRNQTLSDLLVHYDVVAKVQSALDASTVANTVGGALGGVVGGAKIVFGTVFSTLTVMVLTIYFMFAFDRIKSGAYALVPASRRRRVELLSDEILSKVGAYMVGALAIGVVAGLATWVFGLIIGLAR